MILHNRSVHLPHPMWSVLNPSVLPFLITALVALPIITAAICIVLGKSIRLQRILSLIVLLISTINSLCVVAIVDKYGSFAMNIGSWGNKDGQGPPLGITLMVDRFSAIMIAISTIVLTAVLFYAVGQGVRDGGTGEPTSIFQPSYLILCAGVTGAFLAGDLFNLYVSFEVLLLASFVLLTLGGSASRIRAGITYVIVSMVSSVIFLLGITFIYSATGTVNLADLALKIGTIPLGTRRAIFAVLLVGFGIKAAVFPVSSWLPDSYPTAPAPVTAVFAGLLTKVGAYAIIRIHMLLFPGGTMDTILLWCGFFTMIIGIMGAIAQDDIKRLVSFTLVSHMGYIFFGIALNTVAGLAAAIFYTMHHILVQTTMFLVVGLIERQAGSTSLRRLGGLGTMFPTLTLALLIPALNLGGIPPFTGFIGKVGLIQAGVNKGGALSWLLIAGALATSLLTLYVVARVWLLAVWRPRADAPEGNLSRSAGALLDDTDDIEFSTRDVGRMPLSMLLPTAALIIVSLLMSVFARPIVGMTSNSASDLKGRTDYISTVLGPEATKKLAHQSRREGG